VRLIDGCERLLELQLASANEIEVLKSKKGMDVFEVESCVRGHHICLDIIRWKRIDVLARLKTRVWYVALLLLAMSLEQGVVTYTLPVEVFATGIKNLDR